MPDRPSGEYPVVENESPEVANERIKKELERAKKAYQNLEFGGGTRRTEEGDLYTELAPVFVHEQLKELDGGTIEPEAMQSWSSLFYTGAEAQWRRKEALALYKRVLNASSKEEADGIMLEVVKGGRNRVENAKYKYPLLWSAVASWELIGGREGEDKYAEKILPYLEEERRFEEVYDRYDKWAKINFDPRDIPSDDEFAEFEFLGLDIEAYFTIRLAREQEFLKEKIRKHPFVSKSLSCLEFVNGEIQVKEGENKTIEQLRKAYASEVGPEDISLLLVGANIVFPEARDNYSKEMDGTPYIKNSGFSRSENVVKKVLGGAKDFKTFDYDGVFHCSVYDPAGVTEIDTYSARGVPVKQEFVYALYGSEEGEKAIKNLKILKSQREARAREGQVKENVAHYFADEATADRVAVANPRLYEYFKGKVLEAEKINKHGQGDSVIHHRRYENLAIDGENRVLAYLQTSGSTDMSSWGSNPSSSSSEIIIWKDGKERSIDAKGVKSIELTSDGKKLTKHMRDGKDEEVEV